MKIISDDFEYAEFNGDAHFYHFFREVVFLSKSGPQIKKCQYKLKFSTQTNSNITEFNGAVQIFCFRLAIFIRRIHLAF